jgi:hypothetical protein
MTRPLTMRVFRTDDRDPRLAGRRRRRHCGLPHRLPGNHAPSPDEQYCYADAVLTIGNATEIDWITRSGQTYRDAAGEEDLGNIDSLQYRDGYYDVTGDWGHVHVHTVATPQLTFIPETSDAT